MIVKDEKLNELPPIDPCKYEPDFYNVDTETRKNSAIIHQQHLDLFEKTKHLWEPWPLYPNPNWNEIKEILDDFEECKR